MKKYDIPFFLLKEGGHLFDFEIDREFFEYFENPEIEGGDLSAVVELYRRTRLLELDIKIDGMVKVQCDRCLDYFDMPIHYEGKLYVKLGDREEELDENTIMINENTHHMNMAQFFYEDIYLSLPYKKIHPKGECNPEMLKKLEQLSFEEEKENIDPRWKGLEKLK